MVAYRYVSALSLDVVLGAVISSLFFGKLLGVVLPKMVLVTLALAVWTVYTLDHLWDAYRTRNTPIAFRHYFHKQNLRSLTILTGLAIAVGLVLIWFLPEVTRRWGLGLTLVIIGYFILMGIGRHKLYSKELLIALVYTCGVITGPFSLSNTDFTFSHVVVTSQFGILVFTNLVLFSYFGFEEDSYQDFGSLARSIGRSTTLSALYSLIGVLTLSAVMSWYLWPENEVIQQSQPVILLMTFLLAAIVIWAAYFKEKDRYRFIGDAIFLLPALAL